MFKLFWSENGLYLVASPFRFLFYPLLSSWLLPRGNQNSVSTSMDPFYRSILSLWLHKKKHIISHHKAGFIISIPSLTWTASICFHFYNSFSVPSTIFDIDWFKKQWKLRRERLLIDFDKYQNQNNHSNQWQRTQKFIEPKNTSSSVMRRGENICERVNKLVLV